MPDDILTPSELHAMKRGRRSKYGSVRTSYNGQVYDSAKEAEFAHGLDLLKEAGGVLWWDRQVPFDVQVAGKKVCRYIADFAVRYADAPDVVHYIDTKGFHTRIYRLKKKLVEAAYGILIREV